MRLWRSSVRQMGFWAGRVGMLRRIFVSFDHDDAKQVGGFRSLKSDPEHPLTFEERSLMEPVVGRTGKPVTYPPTDRRSAPVRNRIRKKLFTCSKLVVLIGDETYKSDWVDWEIRSFRRLKAPVPAFRAWRRITAMALKGSESAPIPAALMDLSVQATGWNPEWLDWWIALDPNG